MPELFDIEDAEETRLREGAEDISLRRRIGRLQIGDLVRLTIWLGERSSETLTFRIVKLRDAGYDGELFEKPRCVELWELRVGMQIPFATRHIHSVGRRPMPESRV